MNRDEFNALLVKADLTKKEFCQIIELNYATVNNWGSKTIFVPKWVKSWLDNYIERQKHEQLKQSLRNSGVCDE